MTHPVESVLPIRMNGDYRQSALVLGTAQLGMAYGIANSAGVPDDDTVAGILDTARRLGVSHVDTARAYGESEQRIGTALRESDDDLAIITKVAPGGRVRESLDSSRAALRRTGPLTVLLHRAADVDDAWADLQQVFHAGEANRIGVSVQSPAELREVLTLPDLGYVQMPCNVLDRRWLDPQLTEAVAAREDLVVTVRSAYLQGLLTAGATVTWPHLPDAERDNVVTLLDGLADDLGRTGRDDLCIAYLLSYPWVTSVVVGAETEHQLRANADLASREPLTEAQREHVLATLPEMPADLLDPSRWFA